MKIRLDECPMTVSNRLRLYFSKYKDVVVHLQAIAPGLQLVVTYTDWKGEKQERTIGEF